MIEANEALSAGELGGGLGELISEEAKRQCARGLFEKKWQTLVYSTATILQCADARSSFGPMIEAITFVAQNKLAALFFDDLPESQYINPLEPETDEDRDRLFQQTIADLVSLAKEKEQIRSLTEDETKEIETERSGWEIKYLEKRLTGGDSFYRFSNTGGRLVFGVRTSESDISAIDISGLFETNPGELTEILGSHMVATYNKKHLWETINRELALHDDELVGMIPDVIKRLLEMEQAECTRVVDRLIQLDCVLRQAGLGSTSIGIPSDQWNRASPEARLAYNRDFRNMLLHMGSCTGVQKDKRNLRAVSDLWREMTRLPANYVDSQRESTLATNENLQRAASYAPRRRSDFLQRSDSHAQLESDTRMKNFYDGLMSNGDSDKGHLDATKLTKLLRESGLNDQASDWEDFTYWLTEVDIDFASVLDTTSRHALFMNLPDRNTIVGIRQLLLDQFDKARPPGKKPFSEWLRFDPDSPSVSFESKTIADLTICLVIEKMYVDKAKYMSKTVDVGAVRTDFLAHSQQRVTDSEEMIQRIQDYKMDFIRKGHIFDVFCKYYGIGEETLGKLERITSYFDEKSGRFEIDDDSYNLLFTTLLVSEGIDNNTLSAYLRFLHPELSQDQLQWFADLRSAMAGKVGRLETKIDPLHPAPYGR